MSIPWCAARPPPTFPDGVTGHSQGHNWLFCHSTRACDVSYNGIRQILDEMIYNLCENAVKYNVKGGKVSVWTGNTLEGPKVIVEDTGIGIPEEEKERVFERFYRVDKSHSRENGGTGLGLSIVKHGALLHDAKIQISSNLGKGTKIELIFGGDSRKETDSENDR